MSALLPCPCCQSDEPTEDCPVCGDLPPGVPVELPTFPAGVSPCPFLVAGGSVCTCPFCAPEPQ